MEFRALSNPELTNRDDATLIRHCRSGDMLAFEILVKRYEHRVMAVAYRIVGDRQDARDVAQEVFIRVYRYLNQFRNERKFFTWLYRIIVNASFDFLKKEQRFQAVPLDELSADLTPATEIDSADEKMFKQQLLLWLNTLSLSQKTAFTLHEIDGFKCKEIAEIMDIPNSTVRSHLRHARLRLKTLIEKHYPEYLEGRNRDLSSN